MKEKAMNRLIIFTIETTPSLKLSATNNEIDAIIINKKYDRKCFLYFKALKYSLKLTNLKIYINVIRLIIDINNI